MTPSEPLEVFQVRPILSSRCVEQWSTFYAAYAKHPLVIENAPGSISKTMTATTMQLLPHCHRVQKKIYPFPLVL